MQRLLAVILVIACAPLDAGQTDVMNDRRTMSTRQITFDQNQELGQWMADR